MDIPIIFTSNSKMRGPALYLLGSPVVESDASRTVLEGTRMHYRPFGQTIEAPKDEVGYISHKFDTDIGLVYAQQRYYDSEIGRFYADDPVSYTDENPVMSFNRYSYGNNNPYKYIDPDGRFVFNLAAAGFGALVGGVGGAISTALSGGGLIEVAAAAGAGAMVGALAGATFGTSLAATAAVGAVSSASGEFLGSVIADVGKDIRKGKVDFSSVDSATESLSDSFSNAVSNVDYVKVGITAVTGAFGGVVDKGAKAVGFTTKGAAVVAETTNVLNAGSVNKMMTLEKKYKN